MKMCNGEVTLQIKQVWAGVVGQLSEVDKLNNHVVAEKMALATGSLLNQRRESLKWWYKVCFLSSGSLSVRNNLAM